MKKMNKFFILLFAFWGIFGTQIRSQNTYTIYPIPQSQIMGKGNIGFTKTVNVLCEADIDKTTRKRVQQVCTEAGLNVTFSETANSANSNIYLGVAKSGGVADKKADAFSLNKEVLSKSGKYDRHILHLTAENDHAQVVIVGENSTAVFHALASLEQIFERGVEKLIPVTLYDYADQQSRGLVEGYYGYPYSLEVKKDLMRFMMRMKMNTYMYGAKSDSYHSEKWEQPYPETLTPQQIKNGLLSQKMMKELTEVSAETKVNFIWAIHPGNQFIGNANVVNRIMRKFESMYNLGVRQFAIFVDDVGVPTNEADCKTNADRLTAVQNAIDQKWNTSTATPEQQVKPLHFVPQVYTLSWVNEATRQRFYSALSKTPEKITIYFTGMGVWTVPNSGDLAIAKRELGRSLAWWWNYPCNDNADGQIYPSDMYYNFFEMPQVDGNAKLPSTLQNGLGIVSNPMQQGQVSKIALFSVADYAWNNRTFNNKKSWEASFSAILDTKEKREAFKTIIPYLRWNDPQEMQTAITSYKSGRVQLLGRILTRLENAIQVMIGLKTSPKENERMLYADLAPWLLKLQSMVRIGTEMTNISLSFNKEEKWEKYLIANDSIHQLDVNNAFTAYALEGLGKYISVSHRQSEPANKYFYPFMSYLKENGLGKNFFGTPAKDIELLRSAPSVSGKAILSSGVAFLNASSSVLPPQGYVGFTLKDGVAPKEIVVSDALLESCHLLYSTNGKQWKRMQSSTLPKGEFVKHLVLQNVTSAPITLRLNKESFSLHYPQLPALKDIAVPAERFGDGTSQALGKRAIIDNNPQTFFACHKNQANGDLYTVTLAMPTDVKDVRVYFGMKNDDYLQSGRIEASADGNHWQPFHLKGSGGFAGGNDQAVSFTHDVKYLDFIGNVENARFVRLKVQVPKTDKWLRLYDIQVNPSAYAENFQSSTTDKFGQRVDEPSDFKPYTAVKQVQGGELYYSFTDIAYLDAVEIYWNPSVWKEELPQIQLTGDGVSWQTVEELKSALTRVDLSKLSKSLRMRLVWKGNTVPAIYEIRELHSTTDHPTVGVTGIRNLDRNKVAPDALYIYNLHGRLLRKDGRTEGLPSGLYMVGNKKVYIK